MNNDRQFEFASADTVLSALTIGGFAFVCGLVVLIQGTQALVA